MKKPTNVEELTNLFANRECAIWGAGVIGRKVWVALKNIKLSPICFIDSTLTGTEEKSGLPIYVPSDFINSHPECFIILGIASEKPKQEVIHQLDGLGVSLDRVITYEEVTEIFKDVKLNWQNSGEFTWNFKYTRKMLERLSTWISKEIVSIADLGCGNQHLRTLLPSNIKYIPIDYVSRSDDTIICDFNKEEIPPISVDVSFISGVLHYLYNPMNFLRQACEIASMEIIIRQAIIENIDSTKLNMLGHVSVYTVKEIEDVIKNQGFDIVQKEIVTLNGIDWILMKGVRSSVPSNTKI